MDIDQGEVFLMARFSTGGALRMRGRRSFGLRGMEGKPLHPPLTDIPVAAYVIAPIMDVVAFAGRAEPWAPELTLAAGWVLLAGVAVAVLAALTGFMDWRAMVPGSAMRRMANSHALLMVAATTLALVDLGLRYLGGPADQPRGALAGVGTAILFLVLIGGMIGGAMVFDHGYNVRRADERPRALQSVRRAG